MIKIAPSILSADFANLERDIRRVSSADWLHVDVMDGCFVPNLTIGVPVVQSIRKCTGMFLDVHLMIDKPVRYVEAFAQAGADLLSVHLEADHPTGIAEALRRMEACGRVVNCLTGYGEMNRKNRELYEQALAMGLETVTGADLV